MSFRSSVDELNRRRALVARMGGVEKVERQHNAGKLTVRERIVALLDPGSFREIGSTTGKAQYDADGQLVDLASSNFIFGRGRISGQPVVIAADDFTVRGGAADGSSDRQAGCLGADGARDAVAAGETHRRHRGLDSHR